MAPAFVVPAVLVWGGLGLLAGQVSVRWIAAALILPYALYFGVRESWGGTTGLPIPSSRWQVPMTFVRKRRWVLLPWAWGVFLGPGFATRNPYAGFALLPVLVTAATTGGTAAVLGCAIGAAHATARAAAVTRDASRGGVQFSDALLRFFVWQKVDGCLILGIFGLIAGVALNRVLGS